MDQDYLGVDKTYYVPTDRGYEATIGDYLRRLQTLREGAKGGNREADDAGPPPGPDPAANERTEGVSDPEKDPEQDAEKDPEKTGKVGRSGRSKGR